MEHLRLPEPVVLCRAARRVPFFVVTAPDFGISSPADSQLVTAGSSAVYPITISSFDIIGHFSSPIAPDSVRFTRWDYGFV